jgi:predicted Ser/Thr protein kinase
LEIAADSNRLASVRLSWRFQPLAPVRGDHESWREAVERDSSDVIFRFRQLPTIQRYQEVLDPRLEPAAALAVVLAAFEAAPRWIDRLATAWRHQFPAWSAVIDAAVGIVSWSFDERAQIGIGFRIGSEAPDGRGRYELVELTGRGLTGMVFRAIDHVFVACGEPCEVAVKLIPCDGSRETVLLREAGFARRVDHVGVARVLDAGCLDPASCRSLGLRNTAILIVQEFVHGEPLWIWKACHPNCDEATCIAMLEAMREAVDACHSAGVSQGDISPGNFVIEKSGRPRLIDFGRAGRLPDDGTPNAIRRDLDRLDEIRAWLLADHSRSGTRRSRRLPPWAWLLVLALSVSLPWLWVAGSVQDQPDLPRELEDVPATDATGFSGVVVEVVDSIPTTVDGPDLQSGVQRGEVGLVEATRTTVVQTDPVEILFGAWPEADGHVLRRTIAKRLLEFGPAAETERESHIAFALALEHDVNALRESGRPSPGLELLAALAFLSTDADAAALGLALQASSPTARPEQRDLAAIIRAIAASRMGTHFGGLGQAEIEDFARLHGAPGVARFRLEP